MFKGNINTVIEENVIKRTDTFGGKSSEMSRHLSMMTNLKCNGR